MSETYRAELFSPNGTVKSSITGTIQECSNWADNSIRIEGECTIKIARSDDNNCHSRCKYGKICRYDQGSDDREPLYCKTYFKLDDLMTEVKK